MKRVNKSLNDIVVFLTQRYNENEIIARACAGDYPDHLRWVWEDVRTDESVGIDPFTHLYLKGPGGEVSLRTVETHEEEIVGLLPAFIIGNAEEVSSTAALHIVNHDPASVIRHAEAMRLVVKTLAKADNAWPILLMLVQPYKNHMLFEEKWLIS